MVASVSYAKFGDALASGATAEAIRAVLVDLRDDGFFPGKLELGERDFSGSFRGSGARERDRPGMSPSSP